MEEIVIKSDVSQRLCTFMQSSCFLPWIVSWCRLVSAVRRVRVSERVRFASFEQGLNIDRSRSSSRTTMNRLPSLRGSLAYRNYATITKQGHASHRPRSNTDRLPSLSLYLRFNHPTVRPFNELPSRNSRRTIYR